MAISRFTIISSIFYLSFIVMAPGAQAQWYVSINAGAAMLSDADTTDTAAGGSIEGETSFDTGYALTGALGYSWGSLRLEGELSYRKNDLNDIEITKVTAGGAVFSGALGTVALDGDVTSLGFMANLGYDVDTGTPWVPFVGAGIGGAQISLDVDRIGAAAATYDESDTVFAFQVGAGLGYKVTPTTTVNLSYRFLGTTSPEFNDGRDRVEADYYSHNLMLGFLTRF